MFRERASRKNMLPQSFNIKATNIELAPELRAYLEKRFSSLAGVLDFNEPTLKVQIEIGRTTRHHGKGDIFRAEFNIRTHKDSFRIVREASDIHAAIDEARDSMEEELSRAKIRRISFVRRSRRAVKEMVRSFYGAGMKFVKIPNWNMPKLPKLPRFRLPKLPHFKWPWKK
jgi:ribosomal subunit interface protein